MTDTPWRDGQWLASTNEEHWSSSEAFDTKEEALAYGLSVLAEENNLHDGDTVFVGKITKIPNARLAEAMIDVDRMLEWAGEWLYDNAGDGAEETFDVSKSQADDLETLLQTVILGWMERHELGTTWFLIENMTSTRWEQCAETLYGDRCGRHLGHEGDHDNLTAWMMKRASAAIDQAIADKDPTP